MNSFSAFGPVKVSWRALTVETGMKPKNRLTGSNVLALLPRRKRPCWPALPPAPPCALMKVSLVLTTEPTSLTVPPVARHRPRWPAFPPAAHRLGVTSSAARYHSARVCD